MVIGTNIAAQGATRLLGDTSRLLAKSLARLSSGSKLTSPEDDAAGMAVSMRFDAQINRTSATISNLGNATSFSQTQDGFLKKVGKGLDRMSELAVLAQDITKTDDDRVLYNKEFQTLASYINDVATKDFNGVSLFSGTALDVTSDSDGGTFQMEGISGAYLTAATPPSAPGYATGSTQLGNLSTVFDGDADGAEFVIDASYYTHLFSTNTIDDLVSFVNGSTGGVTSADYDSSTGELSITVAAGTELHDWNHLFQDLGMTPNDTFSSTFGVADAYNGPGTFSTTLNYTPPPTPNPGAADISTLSGAASALTTVKAAIDQLATDRATVGASIARLSLTSEQLGTLKDNLSAANSRIKDVDVAEESTQFARYNILVQAGTAMLSQANAAPQSILRLLG